jgi:hypothetical protein
MLVKEFLKISKGCQIILWIFVLKRCPFKEHHFMNDLLDKSQVIQKTGLVDKPVESLALRFLDLKCTALMALTGSLPYMCLSRLEWGGYIVRKSARP